MSEVASRLHAALEWRGGRRRVWWGLTAALAVSIVAWLAFPHALDPLTDGWFGAPVARALRDASLEVRGVLP
jgi:hypothetical protein